MSWKKKTAIIIAVIIGVLVALSLFLPILLDLEKYRGYVARAVGDRIDRQVTLDHLKLSLWGGLGVELRNLSVSNGEGFSKGKFLRSERVKVELKALPLLRKKVEVKQVVLERPDILVERNAQGVYNFSDLLPSRAPAEAGGGAGAPAEKGMVEGPSPPAQLAGAVLVSKLSMRGGSVTFVDRYNRRGGELVIRVSDIELKVDNISPRSPFDFDLKARLGAGENRNVALKGRVTPDPDAAGTASFDLKMGLADLDLSELASYYNRGIPLQLDRGLLTADIHLSGDTGKEIKASGKVSLKGLEGDGGKSSPDGLNISVGEDVIYNLREASVSISPTKMTVGKSELEVYGTISNLKTEPEFDLRVTSSGFYLDTISLLYPPLKGKLPDDLTLDGKADFSVNLKGTAGKLRARGTVDLREAAVAYGGYFEKASGQPMKADFQIAADSGALRIDTLNADLGDLWFDLSGRIETEPETQLDLKFFTSPVPLNTLKHFFPELKGIPLKGRLRLEGTVQGPADRPQELRFRIKSSLIEVGLLEDIIEGLKVRESIPDKLKLTGTLSGEISVSGTVERIKAAGVARLGATGIRYGEDFHKPAGFPMEADFDFTLGKEQLTIDKLKLSLGETSADISGSVNDFAEPRLDLKIASESLSLHDLAGLIPAADEYGPEGVAALDMRIRGEAKKPRELSATGRLDLKGIRVRLPASGRDLSDLNGSALFSGRSVRVPELSFTYGRTAMVVGAEVKDFSKPQIRFSLRSSFFAVEDFLPPEGKEETPGPKAEGDDGGRAPPAAVKMLAALNAEGSVRINRLVHKELELTDLKADLKFSGAKLTVDPMSFNLYGGRCRGFAMVDLGGEEPKFRVVADLKGVDVSRILKSQTSVGNVMRGTLYTTLDVSGAGSRFDVLSKTLRGRGRVFVEKGGFTGFSLLRSLSMFTGISGLGSSGGDETPFDELKAEFNLADGRVNTDPVSLSFGEYALNASGYIGLDRSLAYEVQVTVGETLSRRMGRSSLGAFFVNSEGRIVVPLTVSGTIARPRVTVNQAFLQQRLLEYGVGRLQKGLLKGSGKEVPDILRGILGGLGGRTQQPRNAPPGDDLGRAGERAPLDPGRLLRDLLKNR